MAYVRDPFSIAGKSMDVAEQVELLVVGGGSAGLAAAIEAASRGVAVVLVDENPVPAATMADDIPLLFGQAASAAARNATAMLEAVIDSDALLARAFEAGVDVRLATSVWGLFARNPSVAWLPGHVAGIADAAGARLVGFRQAIVATGHRDMGVAFPGWDLPGVLGAAAAARLARYGVLEATRAVVLGSTAEALATARAMRAAGVEIAAVVEQAVAPLQPGETVLASHTVRRALGRERVEGIVVAGPDGAESVLPCDAIVLGIGAIPAIELLDAVGCAVAFDGRRGGFVPILDGDGGTSVAGIAAIGDCAGTWPAKSADPALAQAEGRRAAAAAAKTLGHDEGAGPGRPPPAPEPLADLAAYRLDWVRGQLGAMGDDTTYVCRCEEVTAREILEVRPPRYLDWQAERRNDRSLAALLGDAAPNPDQVKRLTRAGMGVCQGRRCREQVACLLALGGGVGLGQIPLASYRAPVRPLPLATLGAAAEPAELAAHWHTWFGIAGQARPFWTIDPEADAPRDA